jgi:hypothetical protein
LAEPCSITIERRFSHSVPFQKKPSGQAGAAASGVAGDAAHPDRGARDSRVAARRNERGMGLSNPSGVEAIGRGAAYLA